MRHLTFVFALLICGCTTGNSLYERCDFNLDCDKNLVCRNGICVHECYLDQDCPQSEDQTYICAYYKCVPEFAGPEDEDADTGDEDAGPSGRGYRCRG